MAAAEQENSVQDNVIQYQKAAREEAVDEEQFLTFQIASEDYGIELVQAKEVIKVPKITNVPNTEEYMLGVINLRGQIVPVIDLKQKLGLVVDENRVEEAEKRVIVVQNDGSLVGIMVDNIKEVLGINKNEIQELAESERGISKEYIDGIFNKDEDLVIILDITEVLFKDRESAQAENESA